MDPLTRLFGDAATDQPPSGGLPGLPGGGLLGGLTGGVPGGWMGRYPGGEHGRGRRERDDD